MEKVCSCFLIIIKLGITIAFIVINCIWLFSIIKNSKKEENFIEVDNSWGVSEDPNGVCEKNIVSYLSEGAHETFNFKMKEINKYSTGLVSILLIQVGLDFIFYVILICTCIVQKTEALTGYTYFYIIVSGIISLLNFIFFILFSVYYYKGKIREFKDFGECGFFIQSVFQDAFNYVFIVFDNCKKVFITDLVFLCYNCCTSCLSVILKKIDD